MVVVSRLMRSRMQLAAACVQCRTLRRTKTLRTFANTLRGVNLGAILHGMDSKVNLGDGLLLLNGTNGIVDLLVATVIGVGLLRVHGCGGGR